MTQHPVPPGPRSPPPRCPLVYVTWLPHFQAARGLAPPHVPVVGWLPLQGCRVSGAMSFFVSGPRNVRAVLNLPLF